MALLLLAFALLSVLGFVMTPSTGGDSQKGTGSGQFQFDRQVESSGASPKSGSRQKEGEAKRSLRGPAFQLHRGDGLVSKELLRLAGIPESRDDEFGAMITETWNEMGAAFEKRAELVSETSNSGKGSWSYFIPGNKEFASSVRDQLQQKIAGRFGVGAARVLMPYLDSPKHFSGLGAYDTELTLKSAESMGQQVVDAQFVIKDPVSGKQLSIGGTRDPMGYWSRFGTAFVGTE